MIRACILLFSLLTFYFSHSQCDTSRYISPIFPSINIEENVVYGGAPQWSFPYLNETLLMDIYTPQNDPVSRRPCIIWAHPGGFVLGDKTADDMVALCDSFAHRGYVTATIGYRKGFNPLSESSSERAVYRGTQDGRAAYRFLVENHELYGIDTTRIFFGGSSAGALIAHHLAFLDEEERPNSSFDLTLAPDLECIDCTGNEFFHEVNPLGIIGLWGSIGDLDWVDNDVNTLMVHGTEDLVVPYGQGPPFELFTLPDVFGSSLIQERMEEQGFNSILESVEGEGHEPHGTSNGYWEPAPNEYWPVMFGLIESFCFELIRPSPPLLEGPSVICEGESGMFSIVSPDSICWNLEGGNPITWNNTDLEIEPDSAVITVQALAINEIGAASSSVTLSTVQSVLPEAAWDFNLLGNFLDFSVLTTFSVEWRLNGELISTDITGVQPIKAEGEYVIELTIIDDQGCVNTFEDTFSYIADHVQDFEKNSITAVQKGNRVIIHSPEPAVVQVFDISQRLIFEKQNVQSYEIQLPKGVSILLIQNNLDSLVIKMANP